MITSTFGSVSPGYVFIPASMGWLTSMKRTCCLQTTVLLCGLAPTRGGTEMLRRANVIAAGILIMATVISACAQPTTTPGPSATTASGPKKGGTLILARAGAVRNLDPHKGPAVTSARVFELVYSYLMRRDENLAVQPDLAESMPTLSSDG